MDLPEWAGLCVLMAGCRGVSQPRDEAGQLVGDITDQWTPARQRCDPALVSEIRYSDALDIIPPDCLDQLYDDMSVDRASFMESNPVDGPEALDELGIALFIVFARDAGDLESLEVNDYIRQPVIDMLNDVGIESGCTDNRQIIYNWMTSTTRRTQYLPPGDLVGHFDLSDRTLSVSNLRVPIGELETLLIHEAAHGYTGETHIPCPPGSVQAPTGCDPDWSGAFGFASGVAELWHLWLDPDTRGHVEWLSEYQAARREQASAIIAQ